MLDTTPAAAGPGKSLARVLDELRSPWARAIVFSDAGAARGRFDRDRVEATREWLDRVRAATPLVWLNPMPTSRWLGTSANAIARSVPMYELSTAGVIQAIRMLRVRESKRAHRDGPRR
ncbi:MAG: hypothetical protein E6J91_13185 [Deltaproteobacteria bacterium]|nr:MAG: hypothetical protein E6J91_13185 [Deltaproteobacteria bacterium]